MDRPKPIFSSAIGAKLLFYKDFTSKSFKTKYLAGNPSKSLIPIYRGQGGTHPAAVQTGQLPASILQVKRSAALLGVGG